MMVLGSLTLLPALLGWVGTRIDNTSRAALIAVGIAVVGAHRRRHRRRSRRCSSPASSLAIVVLRRSASSSSRCARSIPHRAERPKEQRFWYRWSRFIQHRPWPSVLGAVRPAGPAGDPAVLDPPRLRRLRQLPRGPDGPPGLRPARRGLRAGHQRPAVHHRRGRRGQRPGRARRSSSTTIAATPRRRHRLPGRTAARRRPRRSSSSIPESAPQDASHDRRSSTTLRDDVIPATGVDAKVGGLTAGSVDFASYLGEPHAAAHRRRAAAQLPPADGRVPQRPRAAQGGA